MTDTEIIGKTAAFVKSELEHAEGGHDWWHIERVWKNAVTIARSEPASLFVVELGALLHDIADHKFHGGDESVGVGKARVFLESLCVDEQVTDHVEKIMTNISFRGGNHTPGFFSMELAVVQDADRLDAIGAIGIARAFNYGGFRGRELYNPSIAPVSGMTVAQYQNSHAPTINHFYEKLLLLKDRMNTATGRKMAEQRHRFMEHYLQHFFSEWQGDQVTGG
ncbi:MAG: HD domain-containing protein [Bacteroidetes bacterium]|nr:HD domain-containing protein [Bacteroidota bacterium]